MSRKAKPRPMLDADAIDQQETQQSEETIYVSQSGQNFCFSKAGLKISAMGVSGGGVHVPPGFRIQSINELDLARAVKIGSGSSGKVLECLHIPSQQWLVVKVISVEDDRARNEILKELEALYCDTNRFIVTFYGAFFLEGTIHIVLERMDGSLLDAVSIMGCVPEAICRAVAYFVTQGLVYLHNERRKIHRDIKPSNLLFHQSGIVKITDFGVSSSVLNTVGCANTFVGTVTYMSPERLQGGSYSYSSDIWSLGLSLIECVKGTHPLRALSSSGDTTVNYWDIFQRVGRAEVSFLDPDRDSVSPEMCDFVSRCVEKDQASRASAISLITHPWLAGLTYEKAAEIVRPFAEEVILRKKCAERERDRTIEQSKAGAEATLDSMLAGF
eukprot:Sspe_Gene.109826::Locus_90022_Transcript_1_1_Confidence_1.000_Length_1472::g.109826::m.109826